MILDLLKIEEASGLETRSGSAFQVSWREASRTKLGVEGQGSLHAMTAQLPRVLDGWSGLSI